MWTCAKTQKRAPQMAHFLQIHCYLQSICICGPQAPFVFFLPFWSVLFAQLAEAGEDIYVSWLIRVKTSIIIYIYLSTRIYICRCLNIICIFRKICIYIHKRICTFVNLQIYIIYIICTRYFRHTSGHPRQCSQAWNLQSKPAERGRLHPIMLTVNNLPKPPSGMPQNRSTPTWHRLCKCRSWA